MNLQKLKESLSSIGQELCLEGMTSASKEADELFMAVNCVYQARRFIETVIDIRVKNEKLGPKVFEAMFRDPVIAGDSTTLSARSGVVRGSEGESSVSGETQTHDAVEQK